MFLSDKEVIELTGYKQPTKQCVKLEGDGIHFIADRYGKPKVTWGNVEAANSPRRGKDR
ncbi:DUF4224 domain-containing protein [bacterium]|jgi:hypothetical protein|nr:DUF4224 domain-containing protein [bacterium]